jgi:hypothetical protein
MTMVLVTEMTIDIILIRIIKARMLCMIGMARLIVIVKYWRLRIVVKMRVIVIMSPTLTNHLSFPPRPREIAVAIQLFI